MIPKRPRSKLDPFTALLLVVALGMSVTIAYQLHLQGQLEFVVTRNAHNVTPFPRQAESISHNLVSPFDISTRFDVGTR